MFPSNQRHSDFTVDVFLCLFIAAVACAIYFSGVGASMALNSDIVMPYVMYTDAVAGNNSLSGWLMPEAPYWFPDLLLTWLIYSGTSLRLAVNIFAFVQVASYLLLTRWVLNLISVQHGRATWQVFLLLWLIAFLMGIRTHAGWFENFHQYVFLPYSHAGALLLTLASLGLVLRLQRNSENFGTLSVFVVLAVMTVLSDRLYALDCLLPILVITALPILQTNLRLRLAAAISLILISTELWRWFTATAALTSRYATTRSPALSAMQVMQDLASTAQVNVWMSVIELSGILALFFLLAQVWCKRRGWQSNIDTITLVITTLFIALSITLPLVTSIALGRHLAADNFRYNQTLVFILIPLSWVLARALGHWNAQRTAWIFSTACLLLAIGATFFSDISERSLRDEWRAQSDCIDRAVARYGLHNGLSRYWHANSLNAQLHSPIHIAAITDSYSSIPLNKNIDWLGARADSAEQTPLFDFIDEFQFDAASLDQTFGTPVARVDCPLSALRVYAPETGLLGTVYRHSDWLPQETFSNFKRMSLPAAAWAQVPTMIHADGVRAQGFFASMTPILAGALTLTREPLQGWIDYQLNLAPDADVHWEAVALNDAGATLQVLASGKLNAAQTLHHQEIKLPVATADTHGIGISIGVRGEVDLQVKALGLRTH